jgi:predicted lipoprotein
MGGKSVAIQGFGAIEFALYGTGAETLMNEAGRHSVAATPPPSPRHIETTAGQLVAAWDAPDGVQRDWKHPGPQNPVFRTG